MKRTTTVMTLRQALRHAISALQVERGNAQLPWYCNPETSHAASELLRRKRDKLTTTINVLKAEARRIDELQPVTYKEKK